MNNHDDYLLLSHISPWTKRFCVSASQPCFVLGCLLVRHYTSGNVQGAREINWFSKKQRGGLEASRNGKLLTFFLRKLFTWNISFQKAENWFSGFTNHSLLSSKPKNHLISKIYHPPLPTFFQHVSSRAPRTSLFRTQRWPPSWRTPPRTSPHNGIGRCFAATSGGLPTATRILPATSSCAHTACNHGSVPDQHTWTPPSPRTRTHRTHSGAPIRPSATFVHGCRYKCILKTDAEWSLCCQQE